MALECGVCLENYNTNENFPMILDCGHTFCRLCLA